MLIIMAAFNVCAVGTARMLEVDSIDPFSIRVPCCWTTRMLQEGSKVIHLGSVVYTHLTLPTERTVESTREAEH